MTLKYGPSGIISDFVVNFKHKEIEKLSLKYNWRNFDKEHKNLIIMFSIITPVCVSIFFLLIMLKDSNKNSDLFYSLVYLGILLALYYVLIIPTISKYKYRIGFIGRNIPVDEFDTIIKLIPEEFEKDNTLSYSVRVSEKGIIDQHVYSRKGTDLKIVLEKCKDARPSMNYLIIKIGEVNSTNVHAVKKIIQNIEKNL